MTDRTLAYAAKRLIGDETFNAAIDEFLSVLNKQLLAAATPEDREQKFQEYDGLRRVRGLLEKHAYETKKFEAE